MYEAGGIHVCLYAKVWQISSMRAACLEQMQLVTLHLCVSCAKETMPDSTNVTWAAKRDTTAMKERSGDWRTDREVTVLSFSSTITRMISPLTSEVGLDHSALEVYINGAPLNIKWFYGGCIIRCKNSSKCSFAKMMKQYNKNIRHTIHYRQYVCEQKGLIVWAKCR